MSLWWTLVLLLLLSHATVSLKHTPMAMKRLVILYGQGGLSDVGRHAVQVALVDKACQVTVLTQHPELLDEPNWNCGCPEPHSFSDEQKKNLKVVHVDKWNENDGDKWSAYFENADAVISCVGNRQPTFMNVTASSWCSHEANEMVIKGMKKHNIRRAVAMSSMGIEEDWPPMEWRWEGKIMSLIFILCARRAFKDLSKMERAYRSSGLDYLLIRPVGIGEDVLPENQWKLQTEKYKDADLEPNMAKLDVARYMVQEALEPTRHEDAVVVGGVKKPDNK